MKFTPRPKINHDRRLWNAFEELQWDVKTNQVKKVNAEEDKKARAFTKKGPK